MQPGRSPFRIALIIFAGIAIALLASRAWRDTISRWGSESGAYPTANGARPPEKQVTPAPGEFDRIIIRNIATVPFGEVFDLLRSATPERRAGWIRELEEMPAGPQRTAALASFYRTLVQLYPEAAAASVVTLKDDGTRYIAVDAMIAAAPLSSMSAMAEMLAKLPADFSLIQERWLSDVISRWSMLEPEATATFLEAHQDISADYSSTLLLNWAQLDPLGAKGWVESQPESKQTEDVINGLISGWFERDEAGAWAFATAHSGEKRFQQAINSLAQGTFLQSPEQARAFLLGIENAEARKSAVSGIASITNGIILGGSDSWRRPPEEVANWLVTLPREAWQEAIGTVLENWQREDEGRMSDWLERLPQETHDYAVSAFCSFWNSVDKPEPTIQRVMTVKDPALREQTLREFVGHWLFGSRKQALAKLEKSNLSESQKHYLITLLPDD